MDLPLSGKTAIVTGSSRGIGASIAQKLAADGANVVINYHGNDAPACVVTNTINSREGGKAVMVKADMSTIAGGRLLLEKTIAKFGVPDILVLNAGVLGHKTVANMDEPYYDQHFNTNVKGPLFLVQAASAVMKEGGRVIFVSTTLTRATTILPIALVFTASKGAVEHLVRVLSRDLGERGITVNCIAPGPTDTPLFRDGKQPHHVQWIAQLHPQKRIPLPDEISPLVAFLAQKEANWVNGQIIHVNGGFAV